MALQAAPTDFGPSRAWVRAEGRSPSGTPDPAAGHEPARAPGREQLEEGPADPERRRRARLSVDRELARLRERLKAEGRMPPPGDASDSS